MYVYYCDNDAQEKGGEHMLKKLLALTLIFTLILSSASFAFAGDNGKGNSDKVKPKKEREINENIEGEEDSISEDDEVKSKHWKESRDKLEQEKDEIEALKDEIEAAKDELEKQYEEIEDEENSVIAEELKLQIEELKGKLQELKLDMKAIKLERKEVVRNKYTEEELNKIEEAKEELLKAGEDIKVLDVDSILSSEAEMKFDTPPVIKGNRTLVPVRAIVEGFGADVEWDGETREVTVIKGDIEILLPLDYNEVYVNGEKVELDTKSEIMNSRTYVPLRFIVETFGLKVDWDGETETIELVEDEESDIDEESEEENNEDEVVIEDIDDAVTIEDIDNTDANESSDEE